jgi:hypothetical protein
MSSTIRVERQIREPKKRQLNADQVDAQLLASMYASTFRPWTIDGLTVLPVNAIATLIISKVDQGSGSISLALSANLWQGRLWPECVPADSRDKVEQLLQEVKATGTGRRREINHVSACGQPLGVAYTAMRLGFDGPVGKHVSNHAFVTTVGGIVFGGVGGRAEPFEYRAWPPPSGLVFRSAARLKKLSLGRRDAYFYFFANLKNSTKAFCI